VVRQTPITTFPNETIETSSQITSWGIPARKEMMQAWADYLDTLRVGAEVIRLPIKTT